MTELWLVRHGTSTANVEKLVTGAVDSPLTEEGIVQARAMGEWLHEHWNFTADMFICSSMQRAIQTAELMELPGTFTHRSELNEVDAGDVSEWLREDFDHTHPDFWSPFDPNRNFPGGESHQDLYVRVTDCLKGIMADSSVDTRIMMVAHAGTISSIFHHAYRVPMGLFSRFVVSNGSLSVLRYVDINTAPELLIYSHLPPVDMRLAKREES